MTKKASKRKKNENEMAYQDKQMDTQSLDAVWLPLSCAYLEMRSRTH